MEKIFYVLCFFENLCEIKAVKNTLQKKKCTPKPETLEEISDNTFPYLAIISFSPSRPYDTLLRNWLHVLLVPASGPLLLPPFRAFLALLLLAFVAFHHPPLCCCAPWREVASGLAWAYRRLSLYTALCMSPAAGVSLYELILRRSIKKGARCILSRLQIQYLCEKASNTKRKKNKNSRGQSQKYSLFFEKKRVSALDVDIYIYIYLNK